MRNAAFVVGDDDDYSATIAIHSRYSTLLTSYRLVVPKQASSTIVCFSAYMHQAFHTAIGEVGAFVVLRGTANAGRKIGNVGVFLTIYFPQELSTGYNCCPRP